MISESVRNRKLTAFWNFMIVRWVLENDLIWAFMRFSYRHCDHCFSWFFQVFPIIHNIRLHLSCTWYIDNKDVHIRQTVTRTPWIYMSIHKLGERCPGESKQASIMCQSHGTAQWIPHVPADHHPPSKNVQQVVHFLTCQFSHLPLQWNRQCYEDCGQYPNECVMPLFVASHFEFQD